MLTRVLTIVLTRVLTTVLTTVRVLTTVLTRVRSADNSADKNTDTGGMISDTGILSQVHYILVKMVPERLTYFYLRHFSANQFRICRG